jgi:hypothetical protein
MLAALMIAIVILAVWLSTSEPAQGCLHLIESLGLHLIESLGLHLIESLGLHLIESLGI